MSEEITKEIKNIKDIDKPEDHPEEEVVEEENVEEEEKVEEEATEEVQEETKEKKPINKKLIFIIGGVVLALILIIVLIIILTHKTTKKEDNTKKSKESPFVTTINKALEDESFDKVIKQGLKENDINANTVCIINMDIDSDLEQELVVYGEEGNKKVLLQLEVYEEVSLEDSFPVDSKDSLGYAYSSLSRENYWYTEYTKNYTMISSAKKIIKEEDFLTNYFALTKTYKEKPILNNCVEYKFDQDFDAKDIEKNAIKNSKVLEDNNIKEEEIPAAYDKYIKDKEEKEKKEKEEKEKAEREAEERRKLEGTLVIGEKTYKYGKYNIYNTDGEVDGVMMLYSTKECVYKDHTCDYIVGDVRGPGDELVPGISLSTGQTFIASVDDGVLIDPASSFTAKYAG